MQAKQFAAEGALHGAAIVGQPGGWSVALRLAAGQAVLSVKQTDIPLLWHSLDSCVEFLVGELKLVRIDGLDISAYQAKGRDAEYDNWFRQQVEQALAEADDPATVWISHEDAKGSWAEKRAELLKRTKGHGE